MKFCRFAVAQTVKYGRIEGDMVLEIEGDLLGDWRSTDIAHPLAETCLLAPVSPGKILGVGLNYRSHLHDRPMPERPELFWKPPSAVIGHKAAIILPEDAQDTHFEGELVIVIGKKARHLSREDAKGAIFGYTCGNDVSERQWQKSDLQWWRAKGSDTFAAVGPWIETELDCGEATIESRINGELSQQAPLSDLIFDVETIVSHVSRYLTLEPGDLIYTGTPGHTRSMQEGDRVEVSISGIGTLENPVRR